MPFLLYLTDSGGQIGSFDPTSYADKLMIWRSVAQEVKRLRAYAVIHIAEMWIAEFDPEKPNLNPTDSPKREEALALSAISSTGEHLSWFRKIYRSDDGVVLGGQNDTSEGVPLFFKPVIEVWQEMFGYASIRPTPDEFAE